MFERTIISIGENKSESVDLWNHQKKKAKYKWKCWYFTLSAKKQNRSESVDISNDQQKKRQNRSESDDLLYHQNNKGEKHEFHFHLFSSILKRLNWWISSVKNKWSSEPLVFFFTAGFAGSFSKTQPLDVLNRWMFISVVQVLVTAIIHLKVIIIQDDGSRFEIKCALLLLFFVYSALFSLVHISW